MLPDSAIRRVLDLLAKGHSQRKVAKLTGVSRGMVGAIAAGKRTPGQYGRQSSNGDGEAQSTADRFERLPRRCRCGRKAYFPKGGDRCLACVTAEKAGNVPAISKPADGELKLELHKDRGTQRRYEEVRRQAEARRRAGHDEQP